MAKLDFSVLALYLLVLALCQHKGSADQTLCAFSNALSATVASKLAEVIPTVKFIGQVIESFTFVTPGAANPIGQLSCDSETNEIKEVQTFNLRLSTPLAGGKNSGNAVVELVVKLTVENGGKSLKLVHAPINGWFSTSHNCGDVQEKKKKEKCKVNFAKLETEIGDHEAFFSKFRDMLKTQKWDEDVVNAFKFLNTAPAADSKISKNADRAVAAINGNAESLPYTDTNFKSQLKNAVFDRFYALNGKTFELKSKSATEGFQVKVEITGKQVAAWENSAASGVTGFDTRIRQFVQPVLQ